MWRFRFCRTPKGPISHLALRLHHPVRAPEAMPRSPCLPKPPPPSSLGGAAQTPHLLEVGGGREETENVDDDGNKNDALRAAEQAIHKSHHWSSSSSSSRGDNRVGERPTTLRLRTAARTRAHLAATVGSLEEADSAQYNTPPLAPSHPKNTPRKRGRQLLARNGPAKPKHNVARPPQADAPRRHELAAATPGMEGNVAATRTRVAFLVSHSGRLPCPSWKPP